MSAITDFASTMSKLGITKSAASDSATKATGSSTLDQASFLQLLTAQLNNQDPTDPVDNSQMVNQMAQMSTVSGIAEMNSTLKGLSGVMGANATASALGYVGKTVLVDGKTAYPNTDGTLTAQATLGDDATDVTATVSDASGKVLRTLDLGAQKAGTVAIDWDGKTDSGATASGGPYTIKANASGTVGATALATQVWAPVSSVTLPSDGSSPTLSVLGVGNVATSAVYQVG